MKEKVEKVHADEKYDDVPARLIRNEVRLNALEHQMKANREEDKELALSTAASLAKEATDRAEVLASELELRADALHILHLEWRESDNKHHEAALAAQHEMHKTWRTADNKQHDEALAAFVETRIQYHKQAEPLYDAKLAHVEGMVTSQAERLSELAHERQRQVEVAAKRTREAMEKSEVQLDKRFESVNEFRRTLSDQATQFMPRSEAMAMSQQNTEKIQALTDRLNTSSGRSSGYNALYGWLVAGIGLLVGVIVAANALSGK